MAPNSERVAKRPVEARARPNVRGRATGEPTRQELQKQDSRARILEAARIVLAQRTLCADGGRGCDRRGHFDSWSFFGQPSKVPAAGVPSSRHRK